jgi:hypothetical protein
VTGWSVPREWPGATVAVLACGPSMNRATADRLRGRCRVIAVNNVGIPTRDESGTVQPALAPWAEVLYAADAKWWQCYREHALAFPGLKVSVQGGPPLGQVLKLERAPSGPPYDPRPTHLSLGGNSGYQAACLAVHFGAARVLLFGFDMRAVGKRKHYYGNHPNPLNSAQNYAGWINNFARLGQALKRRGVALVNCTPGSALRGLDQSTLEAEFPCWTPAVCAIA